MARAPWLLALAVTVLLAGSAFLFQAHVGRQAHHVSCVTPDATPDEPSPAPVCEEHGPSWTPWAQAAGVLLLPMAAVLLVLHLRAHRTRAHFLGTLSVGALGVAAVLFVAWLGIQGGGTLCVPEPRTAQDAGPQSDLPCELVTTASSPWAPYAQGGWFATSLLGAAGCIVAPVLASRERHLTRAQRRHGR